MRAGLLIPLLWLAHSASAEPTWNPRYHGQSVSQPFVEQVLIAEAGGEGPTGLYAVACVMRNLNWRLEAFSAAHRKDLDAFVRRQSARVRADAARVVEALRHGAPDHTAGADHYENIQAFGTPRWARGQTPVALIGHHTFYRLNAPPVTVRRLDE